MITMIRLKHAGHLNFILTSGLCSSCFVVTRPGYIQEQSRKLWLAHAGSDSVSAWFADDTFQLLRAKIVIKIKM